MERRCEGRKPMRRRAGGDDKNPREPQGSLRGDTQIHVATMNGVEGPAEDADTPAFAHDQALLEPVKAPVGGRLDPAAGFTGASGDVRAASGRHMASSSAATPSPVTPEMR